MDFERRLARHKDAVYRQLFRMCGNHEDAEDVLVESMVSAYRSLSDLRDDDSFRAWLVQIGRRACGRLKKREASRPIVNLAQLEALGLELPDDATSPEQELLENDMKRCVIRVLAELPELYRRPYELAEIQGLTMQETADRLGIQVNAAKTRLHRARAMIRKAMEAELECSDASTPC